MFRTPSYFTLDQQDKPHCFGRFPQSEQQQRKLRASESFCFLPGSSKTRGKILKAAISIYELSQLCRSGQKPEIIDVRSETEFAAAHIPGAKCIPLEQLPVRHADLGEGDLVLVCEAGMRASLAQKSLSKRRGRVLVLDGGTRAWREAGLPVTHALRTSRSLERQVRLGAGVLILIGIVLTLLVGKAWILMPALIGTGLTFAGATDICMMGRLLARMPWNQLRNSDVQPACNC
jgi:rhodanese-related sulfurtransferase